jgi:hypothetical protein
MRVRSVSLIGFIACAAASALAQSAPKATAPETFSAKARFENSAGAAIESPIQVHIERYTPDFDRTAVENGLKFNGYPGFVTALRKAPDVGYVDLNGQKTLIRWARETPAGAGRIIVVVTEKPVYFIGGGLATSKSKSRAGYEVALVQLQVDAKGTGTGTMAAAARVKAGGETGVQVDDYAEVPIKLSSVTRQ